MKCPNCNTEMEVKNVTESRKYKGNDIILEYVDYVCPKCHAEFIDVKSLENAWKKARNEIDKKESD